MTKNQPCTLGVQHDYEMREQYLVSVFKDFYTKTGDWPRVQDISSVARQIQRNYGGVVAFRKKHNLGYENYTKGKYRSDMTKDFLVRGRIGENELFDSLVAKHGRLNVHREELLYVDSRLRADFLLFKDGKEYLLIDCFYPKNETSLQSCLNLKIKKYRSFHRCKVLFVQLNKNISSEALKEIVKYKKLELGENQYILTLDDFIKQGLVV